MMHPTPHCTHDPGIVRCELLSATIHTPSAVVAGRIQGVKEDGEDDCGGCL